MAWDNIETPACCKMLFLVIADVSEAMSASRIRERAAARFSETFDRFEIVDSRRFCTAPRVPRLVSILTIAASMEVTAAVARAVPGTRPAAAKGIETSVTAVIEEIDKEHDLVALRMPDGIYKIVKVSNPANLDRASVGDKVRITFTSAWAVSVNPGPGS